MNNPAKKFSLLDLVGILTKEEAEELRKNVAEGRRRMNEAARKRTKEMVKALNTPGAIERLEKFFSTISKHNAKIKKSAKP